MDKLPDILEENRYPGRGIVLGVTPAGAATVLYFIMGRSANSRNRVFTQKDSGIVTEAADLSAMEDPSLIIYAPVRVWGDTTIVTNGDQTDTVYDALASGGSFEQALGRRTFEPDAPNYTPRISGVLQRAKNGFAYKLSIIKSNSGDAKSVQRFYYDYPQPLPGQGHFIHTYRQDGDPLPSFAGEPRAAEIPDDIETFGRMVWDSLDPENKVSLFVRRIAPDGKEQSWVYNKLEQKEAGR